MSASTALTAFNTLVGVFGAGTGLAGLLAPSPLQDQVDGIENDIDAIKDQLESIGGRLEVLGNQVGEGFATSFRTTLDAAFEDVKTSYFELGDLRARRNGVDAQSVISSVDSSVRGFLTLIEPGNIQSILTVGADGRKAISTVDAGNMIEAVNFAVSLRLTVVQELEDGAVGREAVKSALSDAGTAVATIADGLETYVERSDDLFDQQYRPVATYSVSLWTAKEVEDDRNRRERSHFRS